MSLQWFNGLSIFSVKLIPYYCIEYAFCLWLKLKSFCTHKTQPNQVFCQLFSKIQMLTKLLSTLKTRRSSSKFVKYTQLTVQYARRKKEKKIVSINTILVFYWSTFNFFKVAVAALFHLLICFVISC